MDQISNSQTVSFPILSSP